MITAAWWPLGTAGNDRGKERGREAIALGQQPVPGLSPRRDTSPCWDSCPHWNSETAGHEPVRPRRDRRDKICVGIDCCISFAISWCCNCRSIFNEDYPPEMGCCFFLERYSMSVLLYRCIYAPGTFPQWDAGTWFTSLNIFYGVSLSFAHNNELVCLALLVTILHDRILNTWQLFAMYVGLK
jgi:hypothetical protein